MFEAECVFGHKIKVNESDFLGKTLKKLMKNGIKARVQSEYCPECRNSSRGVIAEENLSAEGLI